VNAVVSGVRAGMVSVNDLAVYYLGQMPFGGVGGSGYGRFAGEEGLGILQGLIHEHEHSSRYRLPNQECPEGMGVWCRDCVFGYLSGVTLLEKTWGLWEIIKASWYLRQIA